MINSTTGDGECIYSDFTPERKAVMATSDTRVYIAFLNRTTIVYDVLTEKWQKVPGLKVQAKGNAMLKMCVVNDHVLYCFWTGFSSEFGNNIYYLKLQEGEFWKQVSIEVDERVRQISKTAVLYVPPTNESENDTSGIELYDKLR